MIYFITVVYLNVFDHKLFIGSLLHILLHNCLHLFHLFYMYILSYSYLTENEKFNEKFLSEIENRFRV